jgi:hypothetical protein
MYRRLWLTYTWVVDQLDVLLKKGWAKSPRKWRRVLALAVTELIWSSPSDVHGIVHSWVELSKSTCDRTAGKVINGTLRSLLRAWERDPVRVEDAFPEQLKALVKRSDLEPKVLIDILDEPRYLHWFSSKCESFVLDSVENRSVGSEALFGYQLLGGSAPQDVVGQYGGFFQNISAAEVVLEVANQLKDKGQSRVLDYCAAPGGKSRQMSRLGVGHVHVWDENPKRLEQMKCSGLFEAYPSLTLASEADLAEGEYDAVVLDVPCGNSGVLGKCPEAVRHYWKTGDDFQDVQMSALMKGLSMLKGGGQLFYSTCSIDPLENEERLSDFVRRYDLKVTFQKTWLPSKGGRHGAHLTVMELCE